LNLQSVELEPFIRSTSLPLFDKQPTQEFIPAPMLAGSPSGRIRVNLCAAHAATIRLTGGLKSSAEVRPKDSASTGTVTATLDTQTNEFKSR
jgi:hypothetical protein